MKKVAKVLFLLEDMKMTKIGARVILLCFLNLIAFLNPFIIGFFYTGSGGRDLSGNKRVSVQSSDQTLTRSNKAIAINCYAEFNDKEGADAGKNWKKGLPIRVCRSEKFRKHSDFAPVKGIRYDGIYKVVKYWPHEGKSGHIVWRYEFKRDDER